MARLDPGPGPKGASPFGAAYRGKRVLVTGHTGFKGSWLVFWLRKLGAEVTGYALPPETTPALFEVLGLERECQSQVGDIRDIDTLSSVLARCEPDFVFHLAAQPIVRRSHAEPLETFDVNVRGTTTVLEALRRSKRPCAVVVVSSDKCYENREWVHGYRESDALGGHDPYSASKAAAEVVTASYRRSFFPPHALDEHGIALASARAGNVIGGGDWSVDRILPDAVVALHAGRPIGVRNPRAVRPWQHVLEPLAGYLTLGARLSSGSHAERASFCDAWNFGPLPLSNRTVADLADRVVASWGEGRWVDASKGGAPHESTFLALSIDKALASLSWRPRWSFERAVVETVRWYRAYYGEGRSGAAQACTLEQIQAYTELEPSHTAEDSK
ncbi:MAG: CDP-glucose 4,6-dehydratase [Polyangiaceae bacterium]|nr:CDP-glucose 4,6-dehydratase [Polyangiaceae bacterium]